MRAIILSFCLFVIFVSSKPTGDRVTNVPMMGNFTDFELYSGYLEIPNKQRKLHYIFVESQRDPTTDPLVLWFNGGPGCSSMLGFAQEHGPYSMPDGNATFFRNPNSWNLEANVVYIESPAGVGYSYFWGKDEGKFNDLTSSEDNYAALEAFFKKFPEYKSHDLFISGESYAGIYVPYLAWQIIEHGTKYNLKGIMVGNGVTNYTHDCEPAYISMGFWHKLYSTELKDKIEKNKCNFANATISHECSKARDEFYKQVSKVNVYDVYRECYYDNETDRLGSAVINGELKTYKRGMTIQEYTPFLFTQNQVGIVPPCVYGKGPTDFFNRQEVRDALHIETSQPWELCTDRIKYATDSKASYWIYPILKKNKIRVLHFSGNADGAVPTEGTRNWINSLNWNITKEYAPFYIENRQVGGFAVEYDGLTFASIQGVGHMAAQWSPIATRYAIMKFIQNKHIDNGESIRMETE